MIREILVDVAKYQPNSLRTYKTPVQKALLCKLVWQN